MFSDNRLEEVHFGTNDRFTGLVHAQDDDGLVLRIAVRCSGFVGLRFVGCSDAKRDRNQKEDRRSTCAGQEADTGYLVRDAILEAHLASPIRRGPVLLDEQPGWRRLSNRYSDGPRFTNQGIHGAVPERLLTRQLTDGATS
jgi:hypothetical protein